MPFRRWRHRRAKGKKSLTCGFLWAESAREAWGDVTHMSPSHPPQRVYTFVKGESDGGAEMKELVSLCVCERGARALVGAGGGGKRARIWYRRSIANVFPTHTHSIPSPQLGGKGANLCEVRDWGRTGGGVRRRCAGVCGSRE